MIYDNFIPGHWLDTVDVNDFVNLNKKPFLDSPIFLKNLKNNKNNDLYHFYQSFISHSKPNLELSFSNLEDNFIDWLKDSSTLENRKTKIGYSESLKDFQKIYGFPISSNSRISNRKTTYEAFDDLVTPDIKKLNKIKLFDFNASSFSQSFLFPDFRIIPLYGTKFLIKDKKLKIKLMDNQFQSSDWIESKALIIKEIEALKSFEKFAKKYKVDVTEPVEDSKGLLECLYVCILATYVENPSIPISLSEILPFIDIYFENDLDLNEYSEDELTELLNHFLLRLSVLEFSYSYMFPSYFNGKLFYFGETINSRTITKTTYRFLNFLKTYRVQSFSLRIIISRKMNKHFRDFIFDLMNHYNHPLLLVDEENLSSKQNISIHPFGLFSENGESVSFDAGICDLYKVFLLSLNGGKDEESSVAIFPHTQPIRSAQVTFDNAFLNFKKMLMYVTSSYVEMTNLLTYLSITRTTNPLRHSFYSRQKSFSYFFKFSNIQKVSYYLASLFFDNGLAEFNDKGLISNFSIIQSMNADEIFIEKQKEIIHNITRSIREEFDRLILYKNGQSYLQFTPFDFFEDENFLNHDSLIGVPFETKGDSFLANFQYDETTFNDVHDFFKSVYTIFDNGYSYVSLSNKEWENFLGMNIKI